MQAFSAVGLLLFLHYILRILGKIYHKQTFIYKFPAMGQEKGILIHPSHSLSHLIFFCDFKEEVKDSTLTSSRPILSQKKKHFFQK